MTKTTGLQKTIFQHLAPGARPLRWILPLLLTVCFLLLQWFLPAWSSRLEGWTVDLRFLLRGQETPQHKIVIIALDETSTKSLEELSGTNLRTWQRSNWAGLIERINSASPALVALDVIFKTPGWDEGGDALLAESIRRAGNVALASQQEVALSGGSRVYTHSEPLQPLAQASAGTGLANFGLDQEGAIREAQMLWLWNERLFPSLSLMTATLYLQGPLEVKKSDLGNSLALPINYRGPEGTFTTVSLVDVLDGTVQPDVLKDAIVLVGFTTQLEQDRHATPFTGARRMPGVEIHANVIDNLLSGDWLRRSPPWLNLLTIGLAGLLAMTAANYSRPALAGVILPVLLLIFLLGGQALFAWQDYLLQLSAPGLTLAVVGTGAIFERMIFAERDKRHMRQRFSGMMSAERLDSVMEDWDSLNDFHRPSKPAAVLFSDIRNFTRSTEMLMKRGQNAEMVAFLSRYLDVMSEAVFQEGGVIYRMLGDGLLIMFGMPAAIPNEALSAVRAAVNMAHAAQDLVAFWPLQDEIPFQMGIGAHHGYMVDAIVGRGRRVDYAIVGDPANTAARVESYCKEVVEMPKPFEGSVPDCATVLISQDLYEKVVPHVLADQTIPPFTARGKAEPLHVVRILGLKE